MNNAFLEFRKSIDDAKNLVGFYDNLFALRVPHEYIADLLRAQLVNSVSAMDRYLHEIVRKGILLSFNDSSRHTAKFKTFGLSAKTVIKLLEIERNALPVPAMEEDTKEYWINIEVSNYLKNLAFQDPEKIKDALSYIWNEEHKFQKIATDMYNQGLLSSSDQRLITQKLKSICNRRNQIVHEADFDTSRGSRRDITRQEMVDTTKFIQDFITIVHSHIH